MRTRHWSSLALAICALLLVAILYRSHREEQGRLAFERLGCPSCHMAGGAPSLEHVGRKYDRKDFIAWVTDPEAVYKRTGRKPLNPGYEPMPRLEASPSDVEAISWFLAAHR